MRVLILHFRSAPTCDLASGSICTDPLDSAGTDGVSLEMAKRRGLLEEMGHDVGICSAYQWADFPVPGLEFDSEEVSKVVGTLFGGESTESPPESDVISAFEESKLGLKRHLAGVIDEFRPDLLFVHNVFCLPVHPAATVSLADLLLETGLPCAAIHHDILSEGAYKFAPSGEFAKSILDRYYPPVMPNMSHWTINTRNQRALERKGVHARVIHDSMDFDHRLDAQERARIRRRLRDLYRIKDQDVVLLAAARIVPNKQTELAGRLTAALRDLCVEMVARPLYNGNEFASTSRVVLVLAGRPERGFLEYQRSLFEFLDALGIDWIYAGDRVRPYCDESEDLYALYPEMYAMADFVLYPTGWEGFGNQLLEAFAAELPVAVFEYPVFQEDIAPKGVQVVSLGDRLSPGPGEEGLVDLPADVLARAARETERILTDADEFRGIVGRNARVGREHFGFDVLRAHLRETVSWAGSISP